jgi:hypothetical protein
MVRVCHMPVIRSSGSLWGMCFDKLSTNGGRGLPINSVRGGYFPQPPFVLSLSKDLPKRASSIRSC